MKILAGVKKVPGGLMVVPLILGALVNTFCGGIWERFDGTFTTYLWKSGAMPLLSAFIFCNATTISFRRAHRERPHGASAVAAFRHKAFAPRNCQLVWLSVRIVHGACFRKALRQDDERIPLYARFGARVIFSVQRKESMQLGLTAVVIYKGWLD